MNITPYHEPSLKDDRLAEGVNQPRCSNYAAMTSSAR
jgi:hypothetical protein